MAAIQPPVLRDLLKRYRLAAGLTQVALATRAGVSARSISDLERGLHTAPHRDTLALLASALGLTAEERALLDAAARRRGEPAAAPEAHPVAPQRPPSTAPTNLPVALTSFVGRAWEQGEVRALLTTTRLLTLTGAGGCGKTRLALQVAGELRDEYPDGVWLVELAALTEPAEVEQAVAAVLGVSEGPDRSRRAALCEYLAHRRLLLLLDNCEHLIGACATLATILLRACPHLQILATSRETLGLAGETAWRLPSLTCPPLPAGRGPDLSAAEPADGDGNPAGDGEGEGGGAMRPRRWRGSTALARLAGFEAVKLFVQRARGHRPDFALTEENAAAVARICGRLDGIPLAIEMAAARLATLSVEQVAARLDDRFRLLTGGSRTALPRQQTLRATLDWSYALLGEAERLMLRRLTIFAGGWTLDAAEAVIGDEPGTPPDADHGALPEIEPWQVLDLLTQLVAKSLVEYSHGRLEDGGAALSGSGPLEPRFSLLETIREYGWRHLLASGELVGLRERHARYYLHLAEQAEPGLAGAGQRHLAESLEVDHANLQAALRWAMEARQTAIGLRLGGALCRYWLQRGRLSEGREWLERLLALEDPAGEDLRAVRARALTAAGILIQGLGDHERAVACFGQSLALRRALGDQAGIAESLADLGDVARLRGDHRQAMALHEESLALRRRLGETRGVALSLQRLGLLAQSQGDLERAVPLYQESMAQGRALGDRAFVAHVLNSLGSVLGSRGDYQQATALLEESLAIEREAGHRWGVAAALFSLGNLARLRGEPARALPLLEESTGIWRQLQARMNLALCLEALGLLRCDLGDGRRAATLLEECMALRRAIGDRQGQAITLGHLGRVGLTLEDTVQARQHYAEGLRLSLALGLLLQALAALQGLAEVSIQEGRGEQAAMLAGAAAAQRAAWGLAPAEDAGRRERLLAALRGRLGDPAFAAAWAEGETLTPAQVLALADPVRP